MASKRMFANTVICDDSFIELSIQAQALYFHLGMKADDRGFVNNYKTIEKTIGVTNDQLKELENNGFIIVFDTGVLVIKHWFIHNHISPSKIGKTQYTEELKKLKIKENGIYELSNNISEKPQNNADNNILEEPPPQIKSSYGKYNNVWLTTEEMEELKQKYNIDVVNDYIERVGNYKELKGVEYKSDYLTIIKWIEEDTKKVKTQTKSTNQFTNFSNQNIYDFEELEKQLLSN